MDNKKMVKDNYRRVKTSFEINLSKYALTNPSKEFVRALFFNLLSRRFHELIVLLCATQELESEGQKKRRIAEDLKNGIHPYETFSESTNFQELIMTRDFIFSKFVLEVSSKKLFDYLKACGGKLHAIKLNFFESKKDAFKEINNLDDLKRFGANALNVLLTHGKRDSSVLMLYSTMMPEISFDINIIGIEALYMQQSD